MSTKAELPVLFFFNFEKMHLTGMGFVVAFGEISYLGKGADNMSITGQFPGAADAINSMPAGLVNRI